MSHALTDLFKHNAWANATIINFCRTLDPAVLEVTVPGTYGSIIATLRHTIDSEMSYTYRLTAAWPERPWPDDEAVGLDVLAERATILARAQEQYLAGTVDTERMGEAYGDEGAIFDVRAGIFITQILHHGNEHRAHVASILGALGHEPPELSAWAYALATGRMTLREVRMTNDE